MKPKPQYYGGDPDALRAERGQAQNRIDSAKKGLDFSISRSEGVAHDALTNAARAGGDYQNAQDKQKTAVKATNTALQQQTAYAQTLGKTAKDIGDTYTKGVGDYNVNSNYNQDYAGKYQTTDAARMQQDLDASKRATIGAARSAGGGGSLRTALLGGAQANAQAAQNAQIVRAGESNQQNQLDLASRQAGDQTRLAFTQAGDQARLSARTAQDQAKISALTQAGGISTAGANLRLTREQETLQDREAAAARQGQQTGLAAQTYLGGAQLGLGRENTAIGAKTDINTAQLAADSAKEIARQKQAYEMFDNASNPLGSLGLGR